MKERQHEPPEYVTPPTLPPPKPHDSLVTGQPHPDETPEDVIRRHMAAMACRITGSPLAEGPAVALNALAALVADRERLKTAAGCAHYALMTRAEADLAEAFALLDAVLSRVPPPAGNEGGHE